MKKALIIITLLIACYMAESQNRQMFVSPSLNIAHAGRPETQKNKWQMTAGYGYGAMWGGVGAKLQAYTPELLPWIRLSAHAGVGAILDEINANQSLYSNHIPSEDNMAYSNPHFYRGVAVRYSYNAGMKIQVWKLYAGASYSSMSCGTSFLMYNAGVDLMFRNRITGITLGAFSCTAYNRIGLDLGLSWNF